MDLLSEILQTVKLRGTVYFHARFESPWGMEIPNGAYANYHIVTRGNCWLKTRNPQQCIRLNKGDMALFPRGDSHTLVDAPDSTAVSAEELLNNGRKTQGDEIVFGGQGSRSTSLICGHFEYNRDYPHPLFETLPSLIHLSSQDVNNSNWFATASEMAAQISASSNMGKEAVINRLAESLFIQTMIDYLQSLEDPENFLVAIQDRHIGLVLKSIHDDIAHDWSIDELANIASMSKSVFSSRFHQIVGEPPIIYLARWRMLKARELLSDTNLPISQISAKVGYQSEYAFAKAFKKMTGDTPGSIRRIVAF